MRRAHSLQRREKGNVKLWPSPRPTGRSQHGRGKIRQESLALGTEQGRREAGYTEATAWLGLLATRGADPGNVTASVSHSTLQVHCYVWVTVNICSQTGLPGSASPKRPCLVSLCSSSSWVRQCPYLLLSRPSEAPS